MFLSPRRESNPQPSDLQWDPNPSSWELTSFLQGHRYVLLADHFALELGYTYSERQWVYEREQTDNKIDNTVKYNIYEPQMYECMYSWANKERTNEQTNTYMNKWTNERTNEMWSGYEWRVNFSGGIKVRVYVC